MKKRRWSKDPTISDAQEMNLRLMELASFNEFDGKEVADALRANRRLWLTAVMTPSPSISLLMLRDLQEHWNVSTLWLRPAFDRAAALENIARTWGADEVEWIGGEEACALLGSWSDVLRAEKKQILRLWWD